MFKFNSFEWCWVFVIYKADLEGFNQELITIIFFNIIDLLSNKIKYVQRKDEAGRGIINMSAKVWPNFSQNSTLYILASYSFKLVSNKSGLALSLHQVGNRLRLKVGHGPIKKNNKKSGTWSPNFSKSSYIFSLAYFFSRRNFN